MKHRTPTTAWRTSALHRAVGSLPTGKDARWRCSSGWREAEAAIHEVPVERIHLHEVGALDSIIDIVGAVFGMEWLGADEVVVSPLNVGGGTVWCAHGEFPVPAPATVRLLGGAPIYAGAVQNELVTPTGALLMTRYARASGRCRRCAWSGSATAPGSRDFAKHPNVLRVLVGEGASSAATERVIVIECEIDDMNPQIFGPLMERLYAAGALDVFYAPVQMKKNRPGTLVTVISPRDGGKRSSAVLFRETTTIGVRYQEVLRERLAREVRTVDTPVGPSGSRSRPATAACSTRRRSSRIARRRRPNEAAGQGRAGAGDEGLAGREVAAK